MAQTPIFSVASEQPRATQPEAPAADRAPGARPEAGPFPRRAQGRSGSLLRTGSGGRRRRVRMDAPPRGARPRAWPGPASPLSSAASPGPLLPAGLRLRPPARPRPARQDTAQRPALGLLRHSGEPAPEDRRVSQGPFGLLHDIGPIKTQAPKARLVLKARADSPRKGAGLSPWKGPAPGGLGGSRGHYGSQAGLGLRPPKRPAARHRRVCGSPVG